MYKNKKILVLIPARGGSKRFPGKNIYPLNGKPLIAYPIEAAKASKFVDRVVVSTDDGKIAKTAKKFGAEIPFMRPAELAKDDSLVINAVIFSLKKLEKINAWRPDYIVLLQAVSPLISCAHIDKAIEMAVKNRADSVVAVSEVNNLNHPYNVRKISEDGIISFWQEKFHYKYYNKAKPKFYHAGALWVSSYDMIIKNRRFEGKKNFSLILDSFCLLDIDYINDLELIEACLQYNDKKKKISGEDKQ